MTSSPDSKRDHLGRDAYLLATIMADNARNELNQLCKKEGITIAQYPILWTLCLSGNTEGLAMSEVADGLVTRFSDVTRLVDRLVESGLVSRRPDEQDRRKVMVAVTAAGRKVFEQVTPEIKAAHHRQFAAFSDKELAQLIALLNKVIWTNEGDY